MDKSVILRVVILLLAAGIAVTLAWVSARRRTKPGAGSLIVLALALAIWVITGILFSADVPPTGLFWLGLSYLGATVAPAALFAFTLEYTDRGHWLIRRNVVLLALEPIFIQVFIWTDRWHGLFSAGKGVEATRTILPGGSRLWINAIYSDMLVLIAIALIIQIVIHRPLRYRLQAGMILAGAIAPLLASIFSFVGLTSIPGVNLTPLAFTFTGIAFTYGIFSNRLLDLVPIARDIAIDKMSDGWMVLDKQNRIIDLNPAAVKLIGLPRDKIFDQPAERFLSNWPNLMKRYSDNVMVLDTDGSVKIQDEWRYLNLRVHPLTDRHEQHVGHVIIWRDITERRKADDARQQARDEMFILLHAISSAASRASNLDDFLAESIYQIVYSFQSQASVIFLMDENNDESESRRLLLAAHHGLPASSVKSMSSVSEESDMIAWVLEHREPLLIPDAGADPRVSVSMQQAGFNSLLIVPMMIEGQMLGMIGLMRKDEPAYRTDEIARLTVLAEEVATFIYSDRRRQLAIALTERQRLVRDLHDSVTQKLYGLVFLTEAAQAGLEAGSADMPAQVLSRIGENARQALKEMRLFLYELQPVDLEREGLVAVLNQRLAAVEGRSDVKARLLADDNVSLFLDKQVALYFIAQEALNNVLRHARANSVTVRLKQGKVNVRLEIEDDGCGFEPQQTDKGGMGLRNMRERASLIGGKFKIVSAPEKGTRITVIVRKDKYSKLNQNRGRI